MTGSALNLAFTVVILVVLLALLAVYQRER
jgi:hypothetical protein